MYLYIHIDFRIYCICAGHVGPHCLRWRQQRCCSITVAELHGPRFPFSEAVHMNPLHSHPNSDLNPACGINPISCQHLALLFQIQESVPGELFADFAVKDVVDIGADFLIGVAGDTGFRVIVGLFFPLRVPIRITIRDP